MEAVLIILSAIFCEFIDSYLGMMYGTILSPVLIIIGYNSKLVVPAVLLSQAIGGIVASYRHNELKNADFNLKSKDFKIAMVIIFLGIMAVVVGVKTGTLVSKTFLNTYIGLLCVIMGAIVVCKCHFSFSWKRVMFFGAVSSFNKALSGGGFGPIIASGQIVSGRNSKSAIGTTDFAEAPICLLSFMIWCLFNGHPGNNLLIPLTIGAAIGGYFGPFALSKFKSDEKLKKIVGILAVLLGILTLTKTWL